MESMEPTLADVAVSIVPDESEEASHPRERLTPLTPPDSADSATADVPSLPVPVDVEGRPSPSVTSSWRWFLTPSTIFLRSFWDSLVVVPTSVAVVASILLFLLLPAEWMPGISSIPSNTTATTPASPSRRSFLMSLIGFLRCLILFLLLLAFSRKRTLFGRRKKTAAGAVPKKADSAKTVVSDVDSDSCHRRQRQEEEQEGEETSEESSSSADCVEEEPSSKTGVPRHTPREDLVGSISHAGLQLFCSPVSRDVNAMIVAAIFFYFISRNALDFVLRLQECPDVFCRIRKGFQNQFYVVGLVIFWLYLRVHRFYVDDELPATDQKSVKEKTFTRLHHRVLHIVGNNRLQSLLLVLVAFGTTMLECLLRWHETEHKSWLRLLLFGVWREAFSLFLRPWFIGLTCLIVSVGFVYRRHKKWKLMWRLCLGAAVYFLLLSIHRCLYVILFVVAWERFQWLHDQLGRFRTKFVDEFWGKDSSLSMKSFLDLKRKIKQVDRALRFIKFYVVCDRLLYLVLDLFYYGSIRQENDFLFFAFRHGPYIAMVFLFLFLIVQLNGQCTDPVSRIVLPKLYHQELGGIGPTHEDYKRRLAKLKYWDRGAVNRRFRTRGIRFCGWQISWKVAMTYFTANVVLLVKTNFKALSAAARSYFAGGGDDGGSTCIT